MNNINVNTFLIYNKNFLAPPSLWIFHLYPLNKKNIKKRVSPYTSWVHYGKKEVIQWKNVQVKTLKIVLNQNPNPDLKQSPNLNHKINLNPKNPLRNLLKKFVLKRKTITKSSKKERVVYTTLSSPSY